MTDEKDFRIDQSLTFDVVVLGRGAAGLMAVHSLDPSLKVAVVNKRRVQDCSTFYAQGGIACVMSEKDSFESHLEDTLYAGDGLCHREAVQTMVEDGPSVIEEIADVVSFDANEKGVYYLGHEGAHSHRRILHAGGDAIGKAIQTGLQNKIKNRQNITFFETTRIIDLLMVDGCCRGVYLYEYKTGKILKVTCCAVICATGGYSQLFQETTNPRSSTGDGLVVASMAGADIRDPEFVQFHPTALFLAGAPRFLISEAVRGEGAILRNTSGHAFMKDLHDMAELAPRDVVSRAIVREMIKTGESCVFLDLTNLDSSKIYKRFPNIHSVCLSFGLDITHQWIPIRPAAHYTMGGIKVDTYGRSNVNGFYACGEVASTGVHGANRLASNSLLEALVFGRRTAMHINENVSGSQKTSGQLNYRRGEDPNFDLEDMVLTIKSLMWKRAGVFRTEEDLLKTRKRMREMAALDIGFDTDPHLFLNFKSLVHLSLYVLEAAIQRKESRGAHHRADYPKRNDTEFKQSTVLNRRQLQS